MSDEKKTVTNLPAAAPAGEVLSTMREDGSRRWLRPKVSPGRFFKKRAVVAWILMAMFTITPFIKLGGKPLFLFELSTRRFIVFGTTFHADETLPLAFLMLTTFVGIFLLTALLGRVWCGWACPQTVYMEFLYRPIERFFEGKHYKSPTRHEMPRWKLVAKYVVFLLISLHLANTFLSWFVGVDKVFLWTQQSPLEHPQSFILVMATTAMIMWDFAFWREQMCTLACPYGRFQSVLLDKGSLIVGYDVDRGEPRGSKKRLASQGVEAGDCVDCKLCVTTCPTGIDIRQGLQLECIACTQCIDACDEVMDKVGTPRGLIRYTTQNTLQGTETKRIRPRVVIYPILLAIFLGGLITVLAKRTDATLDILRVRGQTPYVTLDSGEISNQVHVRITNRTDQTQTYDLRIVGDGRLDIPQFPIKVESESSAEANINVILPSGHFSQGRAPVELELFTGNDTFDSAEKTVLGPLFSGL
ncbi:MAG: cytochrome c oxidase accessory protein CcoG [Planctomycetota bacterium]|nr:cytochrome c oxidase accessory protein CcoG [Planctomycetota bacterium]